MSENLVKNSKIPEDAQIQSQILLQKWVVGIGVLLLVIKFAAYVITLSNSILSDALESIINVIAGGFSLYSLYISSLPKDQNHPYGHGKIEFIAAGIEGSLIFIAGLSICSKGVYNLFFPQNLNELEIGILLSVLTAGINFLLGWLMITKGQTSNALVLISGGKHLQTDAYSTVGLIVGLGLVYFTNWLWLDNVSAIFFGMLIIYTSFTILKSSVAGIMDEADYGLLDEVIETLNKERITIWIDIHNFRIIKYGQKLHMDCHLTVPFYLSVEESHHHVKVLEEIIQRKFGTTVELFVHVDPCINAQCGVCSVDKCTVRKKELIRTILWNRENISRNHKHTL